MQKFSIVALTAAEFVPDTDILAVALNTRQDEPIQLGLPPKAVQSLALLFLQKLSEGVRQGILPEEIYPKIESTPRLRPGPSGVKVNYELSGGLRIGVDMPWTVARDLAEKLTALCDEQDHGPS